METKKNHLIKFLSFLLPGIIITYPGVYFYNKNFDLVPFSSFSQLFLILFVLSTLTIVVFWKILKYDLSKAVISASIIAFSFNVYSFFLSFSKRLDIFIVEDYNFLPFFIVFTIFIALLTFYIPNKQATGIVTVFAIIASLLFLINGSGLVYKGGMNAYAAWLESKGKNKISDQTIAANTSDLPDVFFLIFDEAAAFDVPPRYTEAVNPESAVNYFTQKGFTVFEDSEANSVFTLHQIAQRLNATEYPASMDLYSMYDQEIANSTVIKKFKQLGYTVVAYDQRRDKFPTDSAFPADILIETIPEDSKTKSIFLDDYKLMVLRLTPLKKWMNTDPKIQLHRNYLFYVRNTIGLEDTSGPKFVYAHLMLPHEPFAFKSDGSLLPVEAGYENWGNYFSNYSFFLSYSQEVVEEIFEASPGDKIVIVQSDHGPRMLTNFGYTGQIPNFLQEDKFKIINMIYFPGCDEGKLSQMSDPIKTFDVVFDCIENDSQNK